MLLLYCCWVVLRYIVTIVVDGCDVVDSVVMLLTIDEVVLHCYPFGIVVVVVLMVLLLLLFIVIHSQ